VGERNAVRLAAIKREAEKLICQHGPTTYKKALDAALDRRRFHVS